MRQIPLPISVGLPPSFDSFLPGPNGVALAQLTELLQQHADAGRTPPIYLWGPPGSGKTHLLASMADHLRLQGAAVACFGADTALPWPLGEPQALTVFDRCDAYDAPRQQAAFALFVDATARGALVAAAGRVPPVDLPLRDDLRSRLGWGHVMALQPLPEADVAAVLQREAARRGLDLPRQVQAYVLSRFARDLGSLLQLLDRADAFALAHKRALTLPLLRRMLLEEGASAGDLA